LYFAVQQLHSFHLHGISVDIATVFTIAIAIGIGTNTNNNNYHPIARTIYNVNVLVAALAAHTAASSSATSSSSSTTMTNFDNNHNNFTTYNRDCIYFSRLECNTPSWSYSRSRESFVFDCYANTVCNLQHEHYYRIAFAIAFAITEFYESSIYESGIYKLNALAYATAIGVAISVAIAVAFLILSSLEDHGRVVLHCIVLPILFVICKSKIYESTIYGSSINELTFYESNSITVFAIAIAIVGIVVTIAKIYQSFYKSRLNRLRRLAPK